MKMSEAHKRNISLAMKGHKISEATKEKIRLAKLKSGNLGYWTGKQHTEETKAKISKAMTGRKLSKEHKRKISLAKKGKLKKI